MKISLNWLNDYVETGLGAEEIANILSDAGFPCEGIETFGDDVVIDVEVTSNRGDCLSHIGVARELATAAGKELKLPVVEFDEMDQEASEFVQVEIDAPDLCGRYTARVIEGVKIGPSPDWMVKRLEAVGLRSVNNVVDATNYAMMETGQPPHAFDFTAVESGKIIVRRAVKGEKIVSIDGTQCELTPDTLVIADVNKPVGLAGVMGGLDSEVRDSTTTVLLEDAYFDPVCIRTTSRRLSLPSDAAYRFERIVDIESIDWASRRTAQLIVQVAGGRVAKGVVDVYPGKVDRCSVTMRLSRLNKLLGIDVPTETVLAIFTDLGFEPTLSDDIVTCISPTWRSDIRREVDLIEEVARVHGYGKIPTRRQIQIEAVPVDPRQKLSQAMGRFLNGCGFYETATVTFVDRAVVGQFVDESESSVLGVRDVTRKTANLLRPTLLGSLLEVLKTNINAKNRPCRLYEMADTFLPAENGNGLPVERTKLGMISDGEFRGLRGAVEGLVKSLSRRADVQFIPIELAWAQVGADVTVNGCSIGSAGVFSQAVCDSMDLKDVCPCGIELDFQALSELNVGAVKIQSIPRFPAIQRDLSIVVAEETPWAAIAQAVKDRSPEALENVEFVDIYRGKGIASEKKSVTLSLRFRDEDGTLTHETVDEYQAVILEGLTTSVGAELRTL